MILPVKDRSEEDGENPMRYLTGIPVSAATWSCFIVPGLKSF